MTITKQKILDEIRRTAAANGGTPLGIGRFYKETGIKDTDWKGKIWARWGDAVKEAGHQPNTLQPAFDENLLLKKYIALARELGRIPVKGEMQLKKRIDPDFPNVNAFSTRFGGRSGLVKKLIQFSENKSEYDDILRIAKAHVKENPQLIEETIESDDAGEGDGFVYLFKSGQHYKIGRSNNVGRRAGEISIQLPEQLTTAHVISTDDASGIENYWHRRFEAKRKNGEWFELSNADVRAFKRRKFM